VAIAALTTAAVGSLDATQAAGLTGTQIDSFSNTQIAALSAGAVGALSAGALTSLDAGQVGALTALQAAALTATQMDSFSATQIAALSTAAVAALSTAAIGSLDATQIGALTTGQVGVLTAVQAAVLTATQMDSFTAAQIPSLTNAAVAALTTAAVGSLDGTQIGALTTNQVGVLSSVQAAVLTGTQIDSFSNTQIAALSAAAVGALSAGALTSLDAGQVGALTATQSAALSATQIDSFSTTQIAALSTAAVAALSTAAIGSLDATQIGALTTAQVGVLTAVQAAVLTATQIDAFSAAQVGALPGVAIAALSTAAVGSLDATQAAALTGTQIDSLSNAQMAALSAGAVGALSAGALASLDAGQLGALTAVQAAALSATQIDAFSASQVGALPGVAIAALSTAAVGSLDATQAAGLTATQIDSLSAAQVGALAGVAIAALTTAAVGSLDATQAAALTATQIDSFSNAQIAALSAGAVGALSAAALTSLDAGQVGALTSVQAAALTATQIDSFSTVQIAALGNTSVAALSVSAVGSFDSAQFGALSTAQLAVITTLQMAAVPVAAITALTPQTAAGLSNAQLGALTSAQIAALETAGDLAQLSAAQRGALVNDSTPPSAPTIAFNLDSGNNASDRITNDGQINVSGIEPGATWEYSTNGTTWTAGSGSSFTLPEGVYSSVEVRQVDAKGNTSQAVNLGGAVEIDTTPPAAAPVIALQADSGIANDRITTNGQVNVSGINAGARWEYSTNGTTWIAGSGSSFTLLEGTYSSVQVRQIDVAGNISQVSNLGGAVQVDQTIPTLVMSAAAGQDNYISKNETTTSVQFAVSGLGVNDKIQLKADGVNIGSVYTVSQADVTAGTAVVVVNKSDISSANGSKQLTASIVDAAGNTSQTAAQFRVSAVTNVDVEISAPLSLLPTGPAAGGWTTTGTVTSSSNTLQLAASVASSLASSTLGTASQISRMELVVNVPQTTASYNGVAITVGSASYFIGSVWAGANSTYQIAQNNSTTIYQSTGISAGQNIFLQIDFDPATGNSIVRYGTTNAYATGSWSSLSNVLAPTQGGSANVSVSFKKHTEATALTVSGFQYYVAGDVLDTNNTPTLSGTLSSALAANTELAVYAVDASGVVTKLAGNVTFTGLNWSFTATSALAAGNYQLRAVRQNTGVTSLNDAASVLVTTQAVIASDSAGAVPTISESVDVDQNITNQAAVLNLSATRSIADNTVVVKGTLSSVLKAGETIWLYDGDTFLSEIRTNTTSWTSTTQTLSFDNHKLNARIVNLLTGAIDGQTTNLNLGVQNRNSTINVRDDVGAAQGVLTTTAYAKQRVVTQVMSSLDGWTTIPGGGTITSTAAGWVLTGTNQAYKTITKQVGNSDNVTEMVVAMNAASTSVGNNGLVLTIGSTSLFFGGRFNNTSSYKLINDTSGTDMATIGSLGSLAYLKVYKTTSGANTVWKFATSTDGVTFTDAATTLAWASNANLQMQFQKYDGGTLTVQAVQYEQQSLVTNDSTPTLTGHLDATLASGEELAIYQTVNGVGAGVTTKVGVATIDAVTKDWTFTPTAAMADGNYVFNAVIQSTGGTSINSASVVYGNKLVSIDTTNASHDLPTVVSNAVTLGGADFTYDLTAIAAPTQLRVDKVDLTGTGNNTLKLALADVQLAGIDSYTAATGWSFSAVQGASLKQLLVQGNAGDVINVTDGTWAASGTVANSGVTYNVYNSTSTSEQLLLAQSLTRQGQVL
jgi:hypothetical protein